MIPPRLHGIAYDDIVKYRYAFRRLSKKTQDRMKCEWVSNYHRYQRNVKCPFRAVDELAERIVYEVISGMIDHRHVRDHTWYRKSLRNSGHQERMRRLLHAVLENKEATNYSRCFKWLRIERAKRKSDKK